MVLKGFFNYVWHIDRKRRDLCPGRFYLENPLDSISMWKVELKGVCYINTIRDVDLIASEREANFAGRFDGLYVLCKMSDEELLNVQGKIKRSKA